MRWFAPLVALIALVAALSSPLRASAGVLAPSAHLDPVRVFNPNAESLLAALFAPPDQLSPINVVLFGAPNPAVAAVPAPAAPPIPGGSALLTAVNLRAYTPPAQLPDQPVEQPSVTPVAAVPHAQLARAAVDIAPPPAPSVHFGSYTPYLPALQSLTENVNVPVRVGGVHFSGIVSGSQAQTTRPDAVRAMQLCGTTDEAAACPYLHDEHVQNLAAGTAFNVRAGNTQLDLQVSGSVGHVSTRDGALFQYAPLDPDTQLDPPTAASPADSSLLYYPGLTDVVRHGLDARLAVPVSRDLTIGLQYDRSHYQGSYGALLTPGIDARKDTYLGNVTYQLPNTSSFFTLSARQYRYQDSTAPNFNLTQTRADLSFTVKF